MSCSTSTGVALGSLSLSYKYPRTVGKSVVQTYDTIRFTPANKTWTQAGGQLTMTLAGAKPTVKTFSTASNRVTPLNWQLSVNEMAAYSARFSASVAVTVKGNVAWYGTCTQL